MSRSVLITGANSGIGLATALHLAEHGYDVIGTVRSDEKAETLRAAATERGVVVRSVLCEVTEADSCEQAVLEVLAMTAGDLYGLVNNAGYAQPGAVEDVGDELVRAQLETNVVAPARLARLVLPTMRERGTGVIVNMSSIAGVVSLPLLGWYTASKHALEALSDSLRVEVAAHGVRVVLIEPGSFGTNIWAEGADRLPDISGSAYGAAYERMTANLDNSRFLPDPVWVARAVRLALSGRSPLTRYLVGIDAMAGSAFESLAPTQLADLVKRAGIGLLGKK
jgi:NAD(P)-dependent dehydrogenase (short-subunit alcohol dehydrogenase family)